MEAACVTSKGQVTIPKILRQKFGIRQGSKVEFSIVGDHVELHVVNNPVEVERSGFGLLKTQKTAVPVDFDAALLLGKSKTAK